MTQCQKDVMVINQTRYTVKGRFLKSCHEPIPIAIDRVTLDAFCDHHGTISTEADVKVRNINEDGSFEITYQHLNSTNNLNLITFNSIVRGGILLFGIPINANVNVGNIYIQNNHSAIIKLNDQSVINQSDTIFYRIEDNLIWETRYKYAVGPFSDGQIIDTLHYTKPQVFDKKLVKMECYLNSNANLSYKIGMNGSINTINTLVEPCVTSNTIEIDLP
ncbi:MAG: hypothetical protein MUE96_11510 [Bacteroidia bacterium]|nr:hypothetical protein [Bacteroidia bacterium]